MTLETLAIKRVTFLRIGRIEVVDIKVTEVLGVCFREEIGNLRFQEGFNLQDCVHQSRLHGAIKGVECIYVLESRARLVAVFASLTAERSIQEDIFVAVDDVIVPFTLQYCRSPATVSYLEVAGTKYF